MYYLMKLCAEMTLSSLPIIWPRWSVNTQTCLAPGPLKQTWRSIKTLVASKTHSLQRDGNLGRVWWLRLAHVVRTTHEPRLTLDCLRHNDTTVTTLNPMNADIGIKQRAS